MTNRYELANGTAGGGNLNKISNLLTKTNSNGKSRTKMKTGIRPPFLQGIAWLLLTGSLVCAQAGQKAQEAQIDVHADKILHPVSRYLTGACLEDLNHQVYGGLYSQMIYGESFQEDSLNPIQGFKSYRGNWQVQGEELQVTDGNAGKIISDQPAFSDGEVGVEVFMEKLGGWNAGLIVRASEAGEGLNHLKGYSVMISPAAQRIKVTRHRQESEPIADQACKVPLGEWVSLVVKLQGRVLEVFVNGKSVVRHEEGETEALPAGSIGFSQRQDKVRYRNLWIKTDGEKRTLPFVASPPNGNTICAMWRPVQTGNAAGKWGLERSQPYIGRQSQRLEFIQGQGQIGVENQGLNRWGMSFVEGKSYEGVLWARADAPTDLFVAMEDGSELLAEQRLTVNPGDWQRLTFNLKPNKTTKTGRFAITLRAPGSVVLGHAFLQPGEWGRFKELPVRADIANALIDQGVTVLRYGGSMINPVEYRWKKMIGPRDQRPPHLNTWYPQASNGWGIFDFLNFCEAAGFLGIPDLNLDETPEDMADFLEYVNGPVTSPWGARRAADGHPAPYNLRRMEIGNEHSVNEHYFKKFKALAETIWKRDPGMILIVGDCNYDEPIEDPFHFKGGPGISSLAAHQKILQLARQYDSEVWFDLHITADGPLPQFRQAFSFLDALGRLAEGAKYRLAIFEFNSGNYYQRRALANAGAINRIERDPRIAVATASNCLQADGQTDNGWNQGIVHFNASQVWLQPPAYVTQMFSGNYLPSLVQCQVTAPADTLDVNATRSEEGRTLVLKAINFTGAPMKTRIHLAGFVPSKQDAQVMELSGSLEARNTSAQPNAIVPQTREWKHGIENGETSYTFPPYSITVLRFD